MNINKSNLIYFFILIGHVLISRFVPEEHKIFVYFAAVIGIGIISLIAILSTGKGSIATWGGLLTILLISYAISGAVVFGFTKLFLKVAVISPTFLTQAINTLLYISTKTWIALTKTKPLNQKMAWLLLVVFIGVFPFAFIEEFFHITTMSDNFIGVLMLSAIVIIFQMCAIVACEKWDTPSTAEQLTVKVVQ